MELENLVDHIYVINLPERVDRRKEMEKELKRIDLDFSHPKVSLFSAIRPSDKLAFPNIGVLGCYLSHLEILRKARNKNFETILIMEDDLTLSQQFFNLKKELITKVNTLDWGIIFLGYDPYMGLEYSDYYPEEYGSQKLTKSITLKKSQYPVKGTHFYAVNHKIYKNLITFLEELLEKRINEILIKKDSLLGNLDGAYIDTAYYLFSQKNNQFKFSILFPSLGWQRSSRSDITPSRIDNLTVLRPLITIARKIKSLLIRVSEAHILPYRSIVTASIFTKNI